MHSTTSKIISASIAAAVASTLLISASSATALPTATSTDKAAIGLFGQQDPTFDGVYRQSLSLIALDAAGAKVPAASVKWLLRQQCDNGRFSAFTDLVGKCGVGDGDATSAATMALKAVGERAAARDAMDWLLTRQTSSGGWEYNPGFGPSSNTTGLVVQAMIAMEIDPSTVKTQATGPQFLRSLQLRCSSDVASDRGALDFVANIPLVADNYATAQATQALAGSALPVEPRTSSASLPALTCPKASQQPSAPALAAGYLGRAIKAGDGSLSGFGPGPDFNSTANAVLSMVAAGYGTKNINRATLTLEANAFDFIHDDADAVVPAAAAALVLVAHATGGDPRSVGASNPVRDILDSRTLAG